jgi:hypothetical protein
VVANRLGMERAERVIGLLAQPSRKRNSPVSRWQGRAEIVIVLSLPIESDT